LQEEKPGGVRSDITYGLAEDFRERRLRHSVDFTQPLAKQVDSWTPGGLSIHHGEE